MRMSNSNRAYFQRFRSLGFAALMLALSACTQSSATRSTSPKEASIINAAMSEPQRAALIARLREAKGLADRGANDHDDDPILTEDFIQQGQRAEDAIESLKVGRELPQYDLEAALQSPAFP